jgi:DNA repair protein RecO (recombination protein O)
MEIKDIGFVLSLQRYQESNAMIKIFSQQHGVCTGFVKNINSKNNKNTFFPCNLVEFTWKARLNEHVGSLRAELNTAYSSTLMQNYLILQSANSLFSIIGLAFKEREYVSDMFEYIGNYLQGLSQHGFRAKSYINFELFILAKAGYSLDFSKCVVTGKKNDLIYLSPKSGKAVSEEAGNPYEDRLLKLPAFLMTSENLAPTKEQLIDALKITNYFFERYIFSHIYNKELLGIRESFINYLIQKYIN